MPGTPLVIAHRGASAAKTENTVEAFAAAVAAGADGVELDLRLTSDDMMVVHHDPTIPGHGPIARHPFARLRQKHPHVATLDEAFAASGELIVNIEIKNDPSEPGFDPQNRVAELVANWITDAGATERVLVSSFNETTVDAVKAVDPAVQTGQLVARGSLLESKLESAVERGHQWFLPHGRFVKRNAELVERVHAAGLRIGVWTVDSTKWLRRLAELEVDAVVTNDPAKAVAVYAD